MRCSKTLWEGSATIYDRALDATYLATHIGGGNHRLFDGGHTVAGAIAAVRDASPDDTVIQEAMGFVQAMFKDVTTPKGLPLANWDKATYDQVSGYLQSNFGIPRDWFYDLNSYCCARAARGRRRRRGHRAHVEPGGHGAILNARRRHGGLRRDERESAAAGRHGRRAGQGLSQGAPRRRVTRNSLRAISRAASVRAPLWPPLHRLPSSAGPAGLALLAGLSAGILAHKATEKVSVRQIGQFMAERAKAAATETGNLRWARR